MAQESSKFFIGACNGSRAEITEEPLFFAFQNSNTRSRVMQLQTLEHYINKDTDRFL